MTETTNVKNVMSPHNALGWNAELMLKVQPAGNPNVYRVRILGFVSVQHWLSNVQMNFMPRPPAPLTKSVRTTMEMPAVCIEKLKTRVIPINRVRNHPPNLLQSQHQNLPLKSVLSLVRRPGVMLMRAMRKGWVSAKWFRPNHGSFIWYWLRSD